MLSGKCDVVFDVFRSLQSVFDLCLGVLVLMFRF